MQRPPRGLAVFDLDGTLLRGPTVCELLARQIGRSERMRELEALREEADITAARQEMLGWYCGCAPALVTAALERATLAPSLCEGFAWLRNHGIATAIASVTWEFAVDHFAQKLEVRERCGTGIAADGSIVHRFGRDKAAFVRSLRARLEIDPSRVACVGDSEGDCDMLAESALPVFVGATLPARAAALRAVHLPGADILTIARIIVERFAGQDASATSD